ncbi:p-loop containing nucleoside triphosphate hydrolase protein [Mycena kentingensis (nom. inval.)]|nr:p-loop containing nucleoside triphosphate hydrolase protein [Mycena kentingensis (nom. inval.)]
MPRLSLDDFGETDTLIHNTTRPAPTQTRFPLFSILTPIQQLLCLVPAIFASVVVGLIAPFMTLVVGDAFDAFAHFAATHDSAYLMQHITNAALELVALAFGSFILSSLTSFLWINFGEYNVLALRKRVYNSLAARDMQWFDATESDDDKAAATSASGLRAQFSKDTSDVRSASSLATGRIIEYLTTAIVCLVIAFTRAWSLTLVILTAVPLLVAIAIVSNAQAQPLFAIDHDETAAASSIVDRAVTGINTVKAFNASGHEQRALATVLARLEKAVWKLMAIWGVSLALKQFAMMGMFVAGFWFGAHLVHTGRIGAGDVMAVFWACLMAATNLGLCMEQFPQLTRGINAFRALMELVEDREGIRRPHFQPCRSDIVLRDVAFNYPQRPDVLILRQITVSLPAGKTTFIVGSSGSGKSTIAQLLAGLYVPQRGSISVDNGAVDLSELDIAVVAQGTASSIFEMTLFENIALVRELVTRTEVQAVCELVGFHEFVEGLPDGYDTILGSGGASLSGGQKQRLALARALLLDPDVLVLDEATSSLDPTSRVAVFNAVRNTREHLGRTTIVITHDLAQIRQEDLVYVLKDGFVAESGTRVDLDRFPFGVFGDLLSYVPPIRVEDVSDDEDYEIFTDTDSEDARDLHRLSFTLRSHPFGTIYQAAMTSAPTSAHTRTSRVVSSYLSPPGVASFSRRMTPSPWKPLSAPSSALTRPQSLRFSGVDEKSPLPDADGDLKVRVTLPSCPTEAHNPAPTLRQLLRDLYPAIPNKPLVLLGLVACLLSGTITPIFSFLLSRLLFEVSTGAQDTSIINKFGFLVLGIAAADGLFMDLKFFLMQGTAMSWINHLRNIGFAGVLKQDRRWFDSHNSETGRVARVLIADGDDARELLAVVAGQLLVVSALFGVGMIWALLKGWQLALAGFAVVPVFALAMVGQARLAARCEAKNKAARDDIGRRYQESIASMRAIRYMRLQRVFQDQFDKAADHALAVARKGAFVEGCTYGLACGLIYLAEAVLFGVGAYFVARGTFSYLQMVQVLNLVIFTVAIGSQLMAFTQRIAKAVHAARDLDQLLRLPTRTDESDGFIRSRLDGPIVFQDVGFSYPSREEVPVLQNVSLTIQPGECVAIVGKAGCGKSTIAALLQRLYEPTFGAISIGSTRLRSTDVTHLREQISIVSQHATLFDATIAENIAYGTDGLTLDDIQRAAEAANIHDFIVSLPQGYETPVGENAALISGGQAQRLQIARALVRPSKILILDECTSALDDTNQAAIMETIQRAKAGRTTVMITHKVPVMKMCDRVLVVHEGRIVEDGRFGDLTRRRGGVFASLISGGELN